VTTAVDILQAMHFICVCCQKGKFTCQGQYGGGGGGGGCRSYFELKTIYESISPTSVCMRAGVCQVGLTCHTPRKLPGRTPVSDISISWVLNQKERHVCKTRCKTTRPWGFHGFISQFSVNAKQYIFTLTLHDWC
jgi:hypothetical protein